MAEESARDSQRSLREVSTMHIHTAGHSVHSRSSALRRHSSSLACVCTGCVHESFCAASPEWSNSRAIEPSRSGIFERCHENVSLPVARWQDFALLTPPESEESTHGQGQDTF